MALQGFDKGYFLQQALAQLQTMDVYDDIFQGQNVAFLEEQLAANNLTAEDLYSGWGWKYNLTPNQYFDPNYYMLALAKWAVDNNIPGCENMTQAKMAVANAAAGQDPYQLYLQLGSYNYNGQYVDINPSASFDESKYLENLLDWAKANGHVEDTMTVQDVRAYFNQNGISVLGNYMDAGRLVNIQVEPVSGTELVSEDAATSISVAHGTAGTADVMHLTGGQDVRIDFTNPANQIKGLDLNGDGVISNDGFENNVTGMAANFDIVDAYPRNPLNHNDFIKNFLGDIKFDGTGFQGDGVNTNGNIFLGGLGADTAFGGIGNDFMTGGGVGQHAGGAQDSLSGGRNADFFFVELSALDSVDGDNVAIDGGTTADDNSAGTTQSAQDNDWLLFEGSDDDEPVTITLRDDTVMDPGEANIAQTGSIVSRSGQAVGTLRDIENVDASGNLYGFLNSMTVEIGGRATDTRMGDPAGDGISPNDGIGSSAQLVINGSNVGNIIIAGYDNDVVRGNDGNDLLMGGNLHKLINPNLTAIPNDGRDELYGGNGDDNIVLELDRGIVDGSDPSLAADTSANDTLWLLDNAAGNNKTVADLTADGILRLDLGHAAYKGYRGDTLGENTDHSDEANSTSTSNWVPGTADQSNYKLTHGATTVVNMENIIATGLGAVDFKAAGANTASDLAFTNQQNFHGLDADLELRGTDGNNILYANTGDDKIEGRQGNDLLSGGNGNDDFIFQLTAGAPGDGVDVIHRQKDANGDNLWDTDPVTGAYLYEQDFGRDSTASAHASQLNIEIKNDDSTLKVGIVSFWVDGVKYEVVAGELLNQDTIGKIADYLDDAFSALNPLLSVRLSEGNPDGYQGTITVTALAAEGAENPPQFVETPGSAFDPNSVDCFINTNDSDAGSTSWQSVGGVDISQDRLIYKAYEDRLDNEGVDDDSFIGSTISLGVDNYAEDLVVRFKTDANGVTQTMIAEDQQYVVDLKNITTEDIFTMTVNGVKYELQVGKALNGTLLPSEDSQGGRTQVEILQSFGERLVRFINSFMDDDTSSGKLVATDMGMQADGLTFRFALNQAAYDAEETVFMDKPAISITNLSGGQIPEYRVTDTSQHSLHLLDFDGRNNALNETNVLFVGEEFINRSVLETADNDGGILEGSDAVVINGGAKDDLINIVHNLATVIDDNFAVHGDDYLIGGTGDDEIYGKTGDDRIQGSAGDDKIDGGKDYYAVRMINQTSYAVEVMNTYEAGKRTLDPNVVEVLRVLQTENGAALVPVAAGESTFRDTLIFAQADFTNDTRFTITLDNDLLMVNGGAGTVDVDVDGDGTTDHHTVFTNFENIRTVSGTGLAVAGSGQGNDTLDVSALSSNSGVKGIIYDLTDGADAGNVSMRMDAGVNNPWAEKLFIKVDGVEHVIAGSGNDVLKIDETEAAKDNKFSAGNGNDIIIYSNQYVGNVDQIVGADNRDAEPTVTINVGNDNTDTVVMTQGRVGRTIATDTLIDVETISIEGNTAQGMREDDALNVTQLAGATVNYAINLNRDYDARNLPDEDYNNDGVINAADYGVSVGRVSTSGSANVLSINNLYEIENVIAGTGNDRVKVADAAVMALNGRTDAVTDAKDIVLDSYLNYDMTKNRSAADGSAPVRLTIAELRNIAPTADPNTHDRDDIPEVINFEQFKFDMGAGIDTVDYSNETGRIASIVEFNSANLTQYVMVDGNSNGNYGDAESRIDKLVNVDAIVASQGDSILDLTKADQDLKITFSNNYDRSGSYTANYDAKYGLEVHEIKVANSTTGSSVINMNYIDYVYVDTNLTDGIDPHPNAVWSTIEGSDRNETVELSGWEAVAPHTLNLRGGNNRVTYEGDKVEITIDVKAPVAADPANTGMIEVVAKHTAPKDLHDADQSDDGPVSSDDIIRSYSAQNAIKAGELTIKGARRDEDSISFNDGINALSKLIILGGVVDATSAIKITIDEGGTLQNSMNLVGFEILQDSVSDDVYSMLDLQVVFDQLTLRDNPVNDIDTIKVNDQAATDAFNGTLGTEIISLPALEAKFGNFDFDVLDITEVVNSTTPLVKLTVFGDPADAELQEIIVGKLDAISDESGKGINDFDILSLTNASAGTGFNLNLNKGELQNTTGTRIFDFDGNTLDASRVTGRDMILAVTSDAAGATVIGSAGNDIISGGSGDDKLMGGAGRDTIDGGADIPEIHKFTITAPEGAALDSYTINGVTITEGATVEGVVVAQNDADAIGSAFERVWNAHPELFANRADLALVKYDPTSNVLSFTFNTSEGDVDNGVLGAPGGTAAGKIALEVSPYNDNGKDIIYAGAGADKVAGGNHDDTFVVIGKVDADDYAVGATAGTAADNFKAAKAAIENGQTVSDITLDAVSATVTVVETISGGLGTDTLELWGDVDFTVGATIEDVENFDVHSTVKLYSKQIEDAKHFNLFDATSKVIIVDSITGIATEYTQANISVLNDMLNPPDVVAPVFVSSTPADNTVDVTVASNVTVSFSEDVAIADANGIVLYDQATSTAVAAHVTVAGNVVTINPDADLANSHGYYVAIANGAVTDLAGNAFAGITDATTLNFTTVAPAIPTDVTETVTAGNTVPYDAAPSNVTFDLASGTYTYNVSNFAAGDKLVFPAGVTPTVNNSDYTDHAVDVQWALGGQVITVHLTNLANDSALNSVSDFNTAFGTGTINVGSVTPPSSSVNISTANATPYDATAANVTFTIASGTYTYNISGFAAGDVLDFPAGIDATVNNTDFADNAVDVQWALGGQVVTIHLTGLAAGQDATLNSVADFNTVFGAGTIV